jgi:hypothetical protein
MPMIYYRDLPQITGNFLSKNIRELYTATTCNILSYKIIMETFRLKWIAFIENRKNNKDSYT